MGQGRADGDGSRPLTREELMECLESFGAWARECNRAGCALEGLGELELEHWDLPTLGCPMWCFIVNEAETALGQLDNPEHVEPPAEEGREIPWRGRRTPRWGCRTIAG